MIDCVFCDRLARGELIEETTLAAAFLDAFPASPGHVLIVPKRHVEDYFSLSWDEQLELWRMVGRVRETLVRLHHPDGFNLGVNVQTAAGQTVPHTHVHVIPRYSGDRPDPRGGVRWVLPEHAAYWEE